MNPTAGSFLVNPRLQRWFATFAIGLPGPTSLLTIYQVSSYTRFDPHVFYGILRTKQLIWTSVLSARCIEFHFHCAFVLSPAKTRTKAIMQRIDQDTIIQLNHQVKTCNRKILFNLYSVFFAGYLTSASCSMSWLPNRPFWMAICSTLMQKLRGNQAT